MTLRILVALPFLVGALGGCVSGPGRSNSRPEIWMTYARNLPHAAQQRVSIFLAADQPAIVVGGFREEMVTLSLHEATTGRLLLQTTQYVEAQGRGVMLKPIPAGRYVVRASQEGMLKAESSFIVH